MAIKQRKQITGTSAQIKSFAGHEGVLAFDKQTKHLHVLSGTAGQTTELANKSDIPAPVDISGKADKTYVDQQLATKQPKGDYAPKTHTHDLAQITGLQSALDGKANNKHTHTIAEVTNLQTALDAKADTSYVDAGLAEKQHTGNYALADSLARVATSGNYNDLLGRPSIPSVPHAYLVDSWHSGANWWRKWSDGFIEQGGKSNEKDSSVKIQLPTAFSDTNYTVVLASADSKSGGYAKIVEVSSNTSFIIRSSDGTVGHKAFWRASGY